MKRIEWALQKAGYRVINQSYPSTQYSIETLADNWLERLLRERIADSNARIHFVTHSMGGIVLRSYLSSHSLERLGRIVMLGPPNRGSELADDLQNNRAYRIITGPAGQQLGTAPAQLPRWLGTVDVELGVIAGDRPLYPWFSSVFPGAHDGKVTVQSTQLEGMKDFLVVHTSHTWMMCRKQVVQAVLRFIERGQFKPDDSLQLFHRSELNRF